MGDNSDKGRPAGGNDGASEATKAKKDPRDVILARRARFVSVALAGVGMMASLEGCDSCGPQVCLEPAPHPVPPDVDNPSVCLKIAPSRDAGAGGRAPADAGAHDADADAGSTDAGADASADVKSLTGNAGAADAGAPDAGRPKPPPPPPRVCLRRVRPPPMPCLSPARVCLMILPDRPPPPPPPPPNVPLKGEREEDSDKRKV